eukprot:3725021-Alexandrium_andersonii.AAC.1
MAMRHPRQPEPAALLRFRLRKQLPGRTAIAAQPHPVEAEEAVDVHRIRGHAEGRPGILPHVDNFLLLIPDLRRVMRCRFKRKHLAGRRKAFSNLRGLEGERRVVVASGAWSPAKGNTLPGLRQRCDGWHRGQGGLGELQ